MIEFVAGGYFLLFCTLLLSIIIAMLFYRYGYSKDNIPGVRTNSLLFFAMIMKNIAAEMQNIPHNCLLLQYLCGLCIMFEKQKIFQTWILNRKYIMLFKAETVEVILKSTTEVNKAPGYRFLEPWLGTSLLLSERDKWRVRRKLLTPSFHFSILKDFLPIFDKQSKVLVSKLRTLSKKPWVDVVPLITICTLDVLCRTAMGVSINSEEGGYEYSEAISHVAEMIVYRCTRPWLWIDAIYYRLPVGRRCKANIEILHNFTRRVIKEKKTEMVEAYSKSGKGETEKEDVDSKGKRRVFLEMLLEHHLVDGSLTEEDVREEVDVFMLEGHDTTTMGISCALYLLGLHPEVQENIIKELDSIFEGDATRCITCADLAEMKYLECVIKEAFRLYPSLTFIARELTEDTRILNYKVKPGYVCIILLYQLHRDPEIFPNPEKFDPERFFPENCLGRHPYAYIPFSAGPRNCIGQKFGMMEVKVILANVFRHFRVESLDPRDKVKFATSLVIRNVDPLRINFIPRC